MHLLADTEPLVGLVVVVPKFDLEPSMKRQNPDYDETVLTCLSGPISVQARFEPSSTML